MRRFLWWDWLCLLAFGVIVGIVSCSTITDLKRKAAYLDEIAGLCSLALTAPGVDPATLRQRVADLKSDAEEHYK